MAVKKHGAPQQSAPSPPQGIRNRRRKPIAVICEGHTERTYFERLNDRYHEEFNFSLQLVPEKNSLQHSKSFSALKAVERAVLYGKSKQGDLRKNIWAVFDRDDVKDADLHAAFRLARKNKINVAFSDPHFELWLWLHFAADVPPPLSGDRTWVPPRLRKQPGFHDFKKLVEDHHFEQLVGREVNAARLARKLVANCPSGLCDPRTTPDHAPNCDILRRDPSTGVHRILESLGIVKLLNI